LSDRGLRGVANLDQHRDATRRARHAFARRILDTREIV
jgi:hypothetical protein